MHSWYAFWDAALRVHRIPSERPLHVLDVFACRPYQPCCLVDYAFACRAQPINHLSGQANQHSTLAILYSILNLKPSLRMTIPAIQIATLCRDIDSKEVGMDEIINGGTTSVGAQLRKFQHPTDPVDIRTPAGTIEKRAFTVHAPLATGDFPAMAAMLAVKGSTSAHRYDRLSTIDQRSPHYGKPNSMLRPNTPGIPSWFKRVTHEDVDEVLAKAAAAPAAQREAMLTDIGRNVSSYDFDNRGGYVANYPFARIPLLDDIDGISTDEMHTSLSSGTGAQEGYLQQYYNIRIKKYYNH